MEKTFYKILTNTLILIYLIFTFTSCKKFIEIDGPNDQQDSDKVFADSSTAISAITGIYSEMQTSQNIFSNSAVTIYCGMSADEIYNYSLSLNQEFAKNQITEVNHINLDNIFWQPAYKFIYSANLAIEKLNVSPSLSATLKRQLIGEAKFIRAFCYFYLVNLFGDVPLILTSSYKDNSIKGRTKVFEIYSSIISDLTEAKNLLSPLYFTSERVRPNKWAASSLLSRCYLYTNQWQKAADESDSIISSGLYSLEPDLNNVFLKGSSEAIWQLKPVRPGYNTYEGLAFLYANPFSYQTYTITNDLLNSFETGDNRKETWLNSRIFNHDTLNFPFKYKVRNNTSISEYYMVFRLAEQYLINAEANLNMSKTAKSIFGINTIRTRSGLGNTLAIDDSSLKKAIEQERRIELLCEWGHRWFDLKRTDRANSILAPIKGITWHPTDVLWPIPFQELNLNPLLTQNPGY